MKRLTIRMNKVLKKIQETNILQIFRPFGQYLVFAIFTCDGKSITLVSVLKKTKKKTKYNFFIEQI